MSRSRRFGVLVAASLSFLRGGRSLMLRVLLRRPPMHCSSPTGCHTACASIMPERAAEATPWCISENELIAGSNLTEMVEWRIVVHVVVPVGPAPKDPFGPPLPLSMVDVTGWSGGYGPGRGEGGAPYRTGDMEAGGEADGWWEGGVVNVLNWTCRNEKSGRNVSSMDSTGSASRSTVMVNRVPTVADEGGTSIRGGDEEVSGEAYGWWVGGTGGGCS
jgi:hypothetical protein